jgi:hypothetical protein
VYKSCSVIFSFLSLEEQAVSAVANAMQQTTAALRVVDLNMKQ